MRYLLITILLLWAVTAHATGPITGYDQNTWEHGARMTIFGSNFGTKEAGPPIKFERFDGQTHGQELGVEGWWVNTALGNGNFLYNNTNQRHSNSTLNAKLTLIDGGYDSGLIRKDDVWGVGKVGKKYISAWCYIDLVNMDATVATEQWQLKLWRVSTGPNHTDYIGSAHQTWWLEDKTFKRSYYEHNYTDYGDPGTMWAALTDGVWLRVELLYEDSSAVGVMDGNVKIRHLLPSLVLSYSDVSYDDILRTTAYPKPISTPKFGHYITNNIDPGHEVHVYWDDIYIDNGWSRVELCDTAVYANATHCEVQIPVSWSDTAITLDANVGGHPTGTKYLFVIDSDDVASDGYAVSVSTTAQTCDSVHLSLCTTESTCIAATGNWCDGVCQAQDCPTCSAENLSLCTTQTSCTQLGGNWCDGVCQAASCPSCTDTPSLCTTETECDTAGWHWCDGACQAAECGSASMPRVNKIDSAYVKFPG